MPLDSSLKISHIQALVRKTWVGRTQTIVFVSNSNGTWSYATQSVIFRKLDVIDPEIPDTSGSAPRQKADALMIVDNAISMTGVAYVALTSTATALAVSQAQKFEVINAIPTGIIPGGTHYQVNLRRYR